MSENTKEMIVLDAEDNDVTYICGCSYWRENPEPGTEAFLAQWCERHAPFGVDDNE